MRPVCIAYNKPRGIVCTTEKVEGNIIDAVGYPGDLLPVGRLDKDSEGLILLTNDGPLIDHIINPKNEHEKEYVVTVNMPLRNKFLKEMAAGVDIGDAVTLPCVIKAEKDSRRIFRIILKQGLNRQIRRMCNKFGYQVLRLQRVRIMNIRLDGIKPGEYRLLSDEELDQLKG
jgi:23S rRNA pseudouridine2604 synthase